jgi:hypothetical protein
MSDGLVAPLNAPPGVSAAAGVQPGSNAQILRARLVIVSGAGDGVFVYAPGTAPALGNPPIAWMGGGLVDPYGNILPSTTGVAASGTFQAGDTIITPAGIFVYLGTPGAGNLSVSIVPGSSGGTDKFGNAFDPGVSAYGSGTSIQLYGGQANFFSSAADILMSIQQDGSGAVFLKSGFDSNLYAFGTLTAIVASTQTINSTAAATVLSQNVAAGLLYRFHFLMVFLCQQSAGTPTFTLSGSAALSEVVAKAQYQTATGGVIESSQVMNGSFTNITGPTMVNNGLFACEGEGIAEFSTAGTFTLRAFTSASADTFEIAKGSYFEVTPTYV